MGRNSSEYEISLWQEQSSTVKRKVTDSDKLVYGEVFYFKENDSYTMAYFLREATVAGTRTFYYRLWNSTQEKSISASLTYLDEGIIDEEKVMIIGSSKSDFEGRSTSNILTENINGTHTLTFSLPAFYFDYDLKEFIRNTIVDNIFGESKIKLKFRDKWYEFIVKNIQERREKKQVYYDYTCQDSYIDELSSQGYTLTFDENNGMGDINELSEKVFLNSGWTYVPTDEFVEIKKEYKKNEDGSIYINPNTNLPEEVEEIVSLPTRKFEESLNRYVTEYSATGITGPIWGYTTTETITTETVQNLITNSSNFIDTVGWEPINNSVTVYTKLFESSDQNQYKLMVKNTTSSNGSFKNTTTVGSKYSFSAGTPYVVRIKMNASSIGFKVSGKSVSGEQDLISLNIKNNTYTILRSTRTSIGFETIFSLLSNQELSIESIELFQVKPKTNNEGTINLINSWLNGTEVATQTFENNCLLSSDAVPPQVYKEEKTVYFKYDNDGKIEYLNLDGKNPKVVLRPNSQKVRTLNASKSNRFNLCQSLAELFEGWPRFEIDFEEQTGKIKRDENGLPIKKVSFVKEKGKENGCGFHYQTNMTSITRTINSEEITTKIFVEKNDTELAENGVIMISAADRQLNTSGENFVINLDYFMTIGKINSTELMNDLYGTTSSDMGYLTNLGRYNDQLEELTNTYITLNNTVSDLQTRIEGLDIQISTQEERINELQGELENPNTPQKITEKNNAIKSYQTTIAQLKKERTKLISQRDSYQKQLDENLSKQNKITEDKENLNLRFQNKYSKFIHEGVWQDSNYFSANEYYLDALKVAQRSAYPEVSYSMEVIDLSANPDYADWEFEVGDITFVTDEEFFGRDATGALNKEEVTLSEISYDLDNPMNNVLTVQNYKTQFEDLFSRIAASAQTVQFKDGIFSKTANSFTEDGEIRVDILQSTLANNSLILAGARDQSVIIDDSGIQLNNFFNASKVTRIIAEGIFLSKDSGNTWTTGITPDGINASMMTTGKLKVGNIEIVSKGFPTFYWDGDGLSAYKVFTSESGEFASDKDFVRLDQHGLFMTKDGDKFNKVQSDTGYISWYENIPTWEDRVKYVEENSSVSLTWNGLLIKSDSGAVRISTNENNIQISDTSSGESITRVILGETGSQTFKYYNPAYGSINAGTEEEPEIINGNILGDFSTIEEFNTLITNGYQVGDGYTYNGTTMILFNGEVLDPQDIVISKETKAAGEGVISDWGISKKVVERSVNNYGLTIRDNEGFVVMKTDSSGTLWLQNNLYIGDVETESPYFGIENAKGNRNNQVIWIGPNVSEDGVTTYTFSVDGNGKLTANNAVIRGTIYATDGSFSGHIEATSGVFKGNVYADIGNISRAIFIGAETDEEDNIVSYKSGIAADVEDNTYPYALWINNDVFTVDHLGKLKATDADISGNINATSGNISGRLSIGEDTFILNGTSDDDSRILVKDDNNLLTFSVDKYGAVYARNIEIGAEGSIEEYLLIGNTAAIIDSVNNNYILVAGNYLEDTLKEILEGINNSTDETEIETYNQELLDYSNFLLDKEGNLTIRGQNNNIYGDLTIHTSYHQIEGSELRQGTGKLTVGNIVLDTDENGGGRIYVKNNINAPHAWEIKDNGDAKFENAYINGTLEVVRFKYDEVQTSSGTVVIRPSCEIREISFVDGKYKLVLTQNLPSLVDDYIFIQGKTEVVNNRIYGFISEIDSTDSKIVYIDEFYTQDLNAGNNNTRPVLDSTNFEPYLYTNGTFLNLGQQNNTGIVINSMAQDVFSQKEAISFYKNKKVATGSNWYYQRQGNLILGNLSGLDEVSAYLPVDTSAGGKNLFDKDSIEDGYLDIVGTHFEVVQSEEYPNSKYMSQPFYLNKGETVYFSGSYPSIMYKFMDRDMRPVGQQTYSLTTGTAYTAEQSSYVWVVLITGVDNAENSIEDLQIEYGNSATAYEPFEPVGAMTYGLYSDNAVLRGTIVASHPQSRTTAGITTNDRDNVVFWAGGTDFSDKRKSTFYVTEEGYVHAENGFYRGRIETVDAVISGRIVNDGLKVDGMSKGIMFITNFPGVDRDISSTPIPAGRVSSIIDSTGLDLYAGGTLRIFDSNLSFSDDDDKNSSIGNNSPYIFSNDLSRSLVSENFSAFRRITVISEEDAEETQPENKGIFIGLDSLEFKSSIPKTGDYALQYNQWLESESSISILFENNKIIFAKSKNYYELEKNNLSPKITSFSEGVIDSLQANLDYGNIMKTLKLGETTSLVPYYDSTNTQDGFDIYLD